MRRESALSGALLSGALLSVAPGLCHTVHQAAASGRVRMPRGCVRRVSRPGVGGPGGDVDGPGVAAWSAGACVRGSTRMHPAQTAASWGSCLHPCAHAEAGRLAMPVCLSPRSLTPAHALPCCHTCCLRKFIRDSKIKDAKAKDPKIKADKLAEAGDAHTCMLPYTPGAWWMRSS